MTLNNLEHLCHSLYEIWTHNIDDTKISEYLCYSLKKWTHNIDDIK